MNLFVPYGQLTKHCIWYLWVPYGLHSVCAPLGVPHTGIVVQRWRLLSELDFLADHTLIQWIVSCLNNFTRILVLGCKDGDCFQCGSMGFHKDLMVLHIVPCGYSRKDCIALRLHYGSIRLKCIPRLCRSKVCVYLLGDGPYIRLLLFLIVIINDIFMVDFSAMKLMYASIILKWLETGYQSVSWGLYDNP
jgi:hypothetical protein